MGVTKVRVGSREQSLRRITLTKDIIAENVAGDERRFEAGTDVGVLVDGALVMVATVEPPYIMLLVRDASSYYHVKRRIQIESGSTGLDRPYHKSERAAIKAIANKVEDALRAARMEHAAFAKPGAYMPDDAYSAEVKEAVRIYMDSWVIGPLEQALAELRGELAVETWDARF